MVVATWWRVKNLHPVPIEIHKGKTAGLVTLGEGQEYRGTRFALRLTDPARYRYELQIIDPGEAE